MNLDGEVEYEDVDEDGLPLKRGGRPEWQYATGIMHPEVCAVMMHICGGRRYFGDQSERRRYKRIMSGLNKGKIPAAWIEDKIAWAKDMNKDRTVITFSALLNAILNASKMKDWQARQVADVIMDDMRGADVIISEHD